MLVKLCLVKEIKVKPVWTLCPFRMSVGYKAGLLCEVKIKQKRCHYLSTLKEEI